MGRRIKGMLTGVLFIIVGAVICGVCVLSLGFNYNALHFGNYKTVSYDVEEDFSNIRIAGKTEDITFLPSKDGKCSVVCYEEEKSPHNVSVDGDTLNITVSEERRWLELFMFWAQDPKITVYLPGDEYKELNIKNNTGNTDIPGDFSFADININTDTGKIDCNASKAGNMLLTTETGKVTVSTVADGKMSVSTSTGNIILDGCDASSIILKSETGSIKGTVMTGKSFSAKSETGRVSVPDTDGGECRVTTSTGNIEISIR